MQSPKISITPVETSWGYVAFQNWVLGWGKVVVLFNLCVYQSLGVGVDHLPGELWAAEELIFSLLKGDLEWLITASTKREQSRSQQVFGKKRFRGRMVSVTTAHLCCCRHVNKWAQLCSVLKLYLQNELTGHGWLISGLADEVATKGQPYRWVRAHLSMFHWPDLSTWPQFNCTELENGVFSEPQTKIKWKLWVSSQTLPQYDSCKLYLKHDTALKYCMHFSSLLLNKVLYTLTSKGLWTFSRVLHCVTVALCTDFGS